MADITLNIGITSLTTGNNYIVDTDLDYSNATITGSGTVIITVKEGGKISNATISSDTSIKIKVETNEVAFQNVTFTGTFRQGGEIVVFSTADLQNYSLPVGFEVKTLFFATQGDRGGSDFVRIAYKKLNHAIHLYPFNPVGTVNPIWVYKEKDKYYAETLGIFAEDQTKIDSNARLLERYGGRSHLIKFGYGTYYIADVNMDECKDWLGKASNYYTLNLEGSNNEISETPRRTYIVTNWRNFVFSVVRIHFGVSIKDLYLSTTTNHWNAEARTHAKEGYGFTRFTSLPSSGGVPHTEAEIGLTATNCQISMFRAGFYSGQWSTGCTLKGVKFLGCRWGFYTQLSSNLSLFEDIQIHQCAFGLTTGGTNCTVRRVEITPENWYRDEEAVNTPFFYGIRSNSGFQSLLLEDIYLEDYMGDTESRAKFITYSFSALSRVILRRCSLQDIRSSTSAYHLEVFRNSGYLSANIQNNSYIADFRDGSKFPSKVRTTENWVLTGIAKDGSFYHKKETYTENSEQKTFEFFSGRNVLHFWKGVPTKVLDITSRKYYLTFALTDHKYYNGLISANTVAPNFTEQLLDANRGYFMKPHDETLKVKLSLHIKGTTLVKGTFVLKVGDLEFEIKSIEKTKGIYSFDFKYSASMTAKEFYNNVSKTFRIWIENKDIDGEILYDTVGKMITVDSLEFDLYE